MAKTFLSKADYKQVRDACGYDKRYCDFFIWFHKLCHKYPKIKNSSAPIRTFNRNQKIVDQICEENRSRLF